MKKLVILSLLIISACTSQPPKTVDTTSAATPAPASTVTPSRSAQKAQQSIYLRNE